jgi:NAD+ synthase
LGINPIIDVKETSIVILDFIKTYFQSSGCKSVVIGLSGGVDSAVTAILCKKALGKNKVKCLFLPDESTPKSDIKHCKELVKKFDLVCEKKDITAIIKDVEKASLLTPNSYALANIKARVRMVLLFEYANMTESLVVGTSNKSELLVGYFTKYGDGGSDIMPIGDLYKTQVFELARFLKIPEDICCKPPTAGLIKGQTDEAELKLSYEKLDKILMGLERKTDISKIARIANVKESDVERIKQMRKKSQHKRKLPLIPKMGLRTPGSDWRSPTYEG